MRIDVSQIEFMALDAGGGETYYYQGQPFTGIVEEFYPNTTNLISEVECVNGSIHGFIRDFHPNGQIEREYFKKFNRIYGEYKKWDENGILILHSVFNNDGDVIQRVI